MAAKSKNFTWFVIGNGSWFTFFGMQMVLFAWLVAIELNEAPDRVGLAQSALMLPVLLFSILGGAMADKVGMRKVAAFGHFIGVLPIISLAWVTWTGNLRYEYLVIYALCMGVIQAFVSPSRDGMLALVANGAIQRAVIIVTSIQFGVQILGFSLAGSADLLGGGPIIAIQALVMLVGGLAFLKIELPAQKPAEGVERESGWEMVIDGFRYVRGSRFLRPMLYINFAVGLNFMGVFMVGIPLLLRSRFEATPVDLSIANIINMVGVLIMAMVLLKIGGIARRGRAVLVALFLGAFIVAALGFEMPYWGVALTIFAWGLGGGVAMTMARSIAQEMAAPKYRARVMALYATAFLGGAPIGSFIMGYLVKYFGAMEAMFVPAVGMIVMVLLIAWRTDLWQLSSDDIAALDHD
jgi:MFS family permease